MQPDTQTLDEVVVVGYGTVKKRDLTGAVASVKSEDIVRMPTSLSLIHIFLPYFLPSMMAKYRDMWFVMAFMKAASLFGSRDSALCNIGKTK